MLSNIVSLILVLNYGWQWFCILFSHVRGQTVSVLEMFKALDAKFILPGSVKMQQVLEDHFAACSQRLSVCWMLQGSGNSLSRWLINDKSFCLLPSDLCLPLWSNKCQNPKFCSWAIPSTAPRTTAIFLRTIRNALIEWEIFANGVLMTVSDNGSIHWRTQMGS